MEKKKDKKKNKKNTSRYAAVLKYEPGRDNAPRVTAAGRGDLARAIQSMAEEHEIPVYQDAELAQTLYRLGVNTEIPPELYEVVAQVLIFVARLDQSQSNF